jgi:hypothetical protein
VLVGGEVGVTTWDGDVVGTTVVFGVLARGVGLGGTLILVAGLVVVGDGAGAGVELAGAVDRAGAGDSVAVPVGLNCR